MPQRRVATFFPWVSPIPRETRNLPSPPGASLGRFGVAAMQLDGWNNSLTAKKAWFLFEHEIACLGAGIASSDATHLNGDTVTIDLDTRRCDLEIDDAEMQRRRDAWQPAAPGFDRGWLQIYRRNVGNTRSGAVLVK